MSLRKMQLLNYNISLRPMDAEEMTEKGITSRPAGVYLMDNVVVMEDLSVWLVTDKELVE